MKHRPSSRLMRRGGVILLVVVLICITHVAVMGSVSALTEDTSLAAFRVETVRAFYASDSAANISRRLLSSDLYNPAAGTTLSFGHSTATYVQAPPAGQEGEVVIKGVSGLATRRVKVLLTR